MTALEMPPVRAPIGKKLEGGKPSSASGKVETPKATPRAAGTTKETPRGAGKRAKKSSRELDAGSSANEGGKTSKKGNKKALLLTLERLLELIATSRAKTEEFEKMVGSFDSLTSKLGNTLNKYFESGKKEKDIFKEMDKNGDGKIVRARERAALLTVGDMHRVNWSSHCRILSELACRILSELACRILSMHAGAQLTCSTHVLAQSKMEFRQYLRDIGIMGKDCTAAQVDKLFMELDADGSGELSPTEIVEGVVLFRKNAKEAKEKAQKAEANAAHWRARAACAEKAAETVRRYEDAKLEIERIKNEPSAESRLAEMFRKKNLKPMDMMQQFDDDKNGAIDLSEFISNIRRMGLEAVSDEDLGRIFASFDSDGSGTLDLKELQTNLHKLNDAQAAEAELLKTLQKDLKTLQIAAQAEQEAVQQQIEEDEATEKAEAALKAEAAKKKEEEEALALAKAEEAKKKKEAKLAEEKALFEEKVYERRLQKQNTIVGIKDPMPMPLAKALTKRKTDDEED